ncbi:T9SS type A sorting domain-containing protein [bacterium]|nr:T9SS type A sorting domain-containing protein [bacterium]
MRKLSILIGLVFLLYFPCQLHALEDFNAYEVGIIYKYWDSAQAITESNDVIYLATGITGLLVLNAEHFDSMYVIGEYAYMNPAVNRLIVKDDYLYAADTAGVIYIFDVEDPANISELGHIDTRNPVTDMFVTDQFIYVAGGRYGIWIIDISDPANPNLEANWRESSYASGLDIRNDLVYITDNQDSLGAFYILDISDPDNLSLAGLFRSQTPLLDVTVVADYAYILTINGFIIVDILNFFRMAVVGGIDDLKNCRDIVTAGNNVFFIGQEERHNTDYIFVIDVSNPHDPDVYGQLTGYRYLQDIFLDRAHLYIADGINGLTVVDGFNFRTAGTFPLLQGSVTDVAINGRLAYTVNKDSGLCIVDFNNPNQPCHLSSYPSEYIPTALNYQDETVYLLSNNSTRARFFKIFDVSDSHRINKLTELELENGQLYLNALFVEDRYSYVTHSYGERCGLTIIDHFYNQNLQEVGYLDMYHNPVQLEVDRDMAYIAAGDLLFIEVNDPTDPQEVYCYSTNGSVNAVTVHNNIAYLADGIDGLTILDVSNPEETDIIGSHSLEHNEWDSGAVDVKLCGSHIFLLDRELGLLVYNVSHPHSPDLVGRASVRGIPKYLDVTDNFVIVDETFSLGIFDVTEALTINADFNTSPIKFLMFSAYPNPFNEKCIISFTLPYQGNVNLSLFDIQGRLLRELTTQSQLRAGQHRFVLDGYGLAAGNYLLRLDFGEDVFTRKVNFIK